MTETPYDSVPILPQGKFCKNKKTGETMICARKQLHPGVVFVGGKKKTMNATGQVIEVTGSVSPVTRQEFDENFEVIE